MHSTRGTLAEVVAPACFTVVGCRSGAATNLASRSTDCTAVGAILCRCGAVAEAAELWRDTCAAGWTMRMSAPAGSLPAFPCTISTVPDQLQGWAEICFVNWPDCELRCMWHSSDRDPEQRCQEQRCQEVSPCEHGGQAQLTHFGRYLITPLHQDHVIGLPACNRHGILPSLCLSLSC